jgi:Sensors of blue-light using FAD
MKPEPLRQILYASKASRPLSAEDLVAILKVARENNQAQIITGMLLYRHGEFLQLLEGTEQELKVLLIKIARDPRHTSVAILLDGPIKARAFGAWSMAFQDVSDLEPAQLPGYSEFLSRGFTSTECVRYPHKALQMLLAFRQADASQTERKTA